MIDPPCKHDPLKIIKNGLRHNKTGDVQKYICTVCFKKFSFGPQKQKLLNKEILVFILKEFGNGVSSRKIAKLCKERFNITTSYSSILNWVHKDPSMFDRSPYQENLIKLQRLKLDSRIMRTRIKIKIIEKKIEEEKNKLAKLQNDYNKINTQT